MAALGDGNGARLTVRRTLLVALMADRARDAWCFCPPLVTPHLPTNHTNTHVHYCPPLQERRISCADALDHPWFREHPLPKDKALMPTFPATNDATQARHAAQRRAASQAAAAKVAGK